MSSTLESELNNPIGFFKRSTLTFEIRTLYVDFTFELRKLYFGDTQTSLSTLLLSLQRPYLRAVTYNTKSLASPLLQ